MKFLLVGRDADALNQLSRAWGRAELTGELVPSVESAYFAILQGSVVVVFLDMSHIRTQKLAAIEDMVGLENELEVVLIGASNEIEELPFSLLRQCFCVMDLPLVSKRNMVLLAQLSQKLNLKKTIKILQDTSNLDGLTRLFNHAFIQRHLDEEVPEMMSQKTFLSLIFLDIDHFKNYNDRNGHPEGDKVLVKIADLLNASVRKFDVIGRYGGEEFVIILPGTSLKSSLKIAQRCRLRIANAEFPNGEYQPLGCVSASFGVSSLAQDWVSSKRELLHTADQALYKAKDSGRNCVWYFRKGRYKPLQVH